MQLPDSHRYAETPVAVRCECKLCKAGFRLPRTMNARARASKFRSWARKHVCKEKGN